MSKNRLCAIPDEWNESWQDLLRVWVIGVGMPTLIIPVVDHAESYYGIILCDVFLHQANAIAGGNPAKAEKILRKMRDELRTILSKPCDWPLSQFEEYPRLPPQNEQPVPDFIASDDDALEVVRVWIDQRGEGSAHVSLLALPVREAAEFCVTLMMLIARNLSRWSLEDESIVFARIKSHFIDELATNGLEIVEGKMIGEPPSFLQSVLNFFRRG